MSDSTPYMNGRATTWGVFKAYVFLFFFSFSTVAKLAAETCKEIQRLIDSGEWKDGMYPFMSYIYNRKELTFEDISRAAHSLWQDGLMTVSLFLLK